MQDTPQTSHPGDRHAWRSLDQASLDAAYDQRRWAANAEQVMRRIEANTALARTRLPTSRRLAYGSRSDEFIEAFLAPGRTHAPVHVFVHGGGWRTGSAQAYAFLAEMFVNEGVHFLALNFTNLSDEDRRLERLCAQLRKAMHWIARHVAAIGGDPRRIHLSGHSSGAHLAAVLLTTNWSGEYGTKPFIKTGLCCSGMYDLEPVSQSSRRMQVDFEPRTVTQLSPIRQVSHLACPVDLVYGSLESPEIKRQADAFAVAALHEGRPARVWEAPQYNHFELVETLANPYGVLGQIALRQIRS